MKAALQKLLLTCFTIIWTLGATLLPASSASLLPEHPTYDEIIESGKLRVAVYKNFPPFSYRDKGKLVGVDVDIANAIADKLGVKADFHELPADETVSDDLRNAIWKGHYMGGTINELMMHVPTERGFALKNNMVVIFGSYYDETLIMARDLEKTGEHPTLAVYRYEKVGVELDSLPDFFLLGFQGGILRKNVVHFTTVAEAAASLIKGELAAIFAMRSQIEAAMSPQEQSKFDLGEIFAPGLDKDRWSLGLAVSHTNRQLGYAIDDIMMEMLANGTVEQVFKKHGLTYTPPNRE